MAAYILILLLLALNIAWAEPADEDVSPSLVNELLYIYKELPGLTRSEYLSPTDLVVSPDQKTLYVAERTGREITFVDISSVPGSVAKRTGLPKEPTGLALSPDGSKLYVTCYSQRRPDGEVCVINTSSGTIERIFEVGHSPRSPVVSPDGSKLYVCNWFKNFVSVVDLASNNITDTIAVQREPYAADITPDGTRLVVANFLPDGRSDVDTIMAAVSIINTQTNTVENHVDCENGAQSLMDICVSGDGKYAYVTHVRSMHTMTPLNVIAGGWINANGVSIIDIAAKKYVNIILVDDPYSGAANPWGIACDSNYLCLNTAGSQELHVMDLNKMHQELANLPGDTILTTNLTFSQKFTTRKLVNVKGPRAVAMAGNKAYVAGYFSDKIDVVDISSGGAQLKGTIALVSGPDKPMDDVRKGEYNFCDATRMCLQKWHSCHSCHPFARTDAIKWDLENDGLGNFKNDKSLLYAHLTPPVMATGVREFAETATRKGVELILFIDPASVEEEAAAIDEYLKAERHVPSPYLNNGRLGESARNGRAVFNRLQCNSCHPPATYYTDMLRHSGLVGPNDHGPFDGNWDTPTLYENWRTAPYLHDGRCATMKDVYITPVKHGITLSLTQQEIQDLVEYINSL
jgi:YVTN family beta-propeller protein